MQITASASPPIPGVPLSLAGRTALITGGSRGIGAATARLFVAAGARVAFSYNTAHQEAEALARSLGGPSLCIPIQHALESPEDGAALVARTLEAFGDLDILVANHGIWPPDPIPVAQMTGAQWQRTQSINVASVFGLCRAAAAHMLTHPAPARLVTNQPHPAILSACAPENLPSTAQDQTGDFTPTARGHIVLIASTAGQRGEAFHADYAASKGALISLTKSLSSELAPHGIYANCVAPGWTHTGMTASVFDSPEVAAHTNPTIPLGRPAQPEEIAGPILFLCTPFGGFISGEILNVNGGAVLTG